MKGKEEEEREEKEERKGRKRKRKRREENGRGLAARCEILASPLQSETFLSSAAVSRSVKVMQQCSHSLLAWST